MLKKIIADSIKNLSEKEKEVFYKEIKKFDQKELKKQIKDFSKKDFFQEQSLHPLEKCKKISDKDKQRGEDALYKKEMGVIFLAGGMGSRLGLKNKGMYKINEKTIFEIFFEKIQKKIKKYKKNFPIGIMTSSFTHDKIKKFLREKDFFGLDIRLFMQKDIPFLSNGKYLFKDGRIISGPDGNGSFFSCFKKALLQDFLKEGIKYVQIVPIDNPFCDPLDPVLIGACRKDISVIAIADKKGRMGGFFTDGEKIRIIEYIDREDGKYFNTGIYCFNINFLQKDFKLDFHYVKKRIPNREKKVIKSEKFLFDVFKEAKVDVLLYPNDIYRPIKEKTEKIID